MKKVGRIINVVAFVILFVFLGAIVANGFSSRQPWSLVCYKCKACDSSCILGIDPQGFLDSALAGNSHTYMLATNVRISLGQTLRMDPKMQIAIDDRHITAQEASNELHLAPDTEVLTYKVQARHAAELCFRCGACERQCVLGLPILRIVEQLRAHEKNVSSEGE